MNSKKMDEKAFDSIPSDLSVVDVYDLASEIGKECEKIIDCYGADAVTALMPKVVNALEMLEALASRNENENTTMQALSDRVASLESEKIERAVFREKLQRELETIEEQWHSETKELMDMVNKLQDENRRFRHNEYKNVDCVNDGKQVPKSGQNVSNLLNESDFQKLKRLRGQMEKQRDELMCRDQEIEEKNTEIENFSIQLERLKSSGRESRKRQKLLQTQVQKLLDERSDLLVQIQDQKREINVLRRSLGFGGNEKLDLRKVASSAGCSLLSNDDLKPLLLERDSLKSKVKELENELKQLKPDAKNDDDDAKMENIAEEKTPEKIPDAEEDDPPVQGPLPYEPDDAPWKRSSEGSGVRKFFRKLFAEQSKSSFQRGTLSTLSKMALSSSPSRSVANI
ncbi:RILP-like protein homolog [Contarinia nasturtii]|uniref:RILP-like protein homolog n=1 Tax=Contarinia nasturtii TaxID=265458 RepID=UPI0012D4BDA4|nr:RILP-like protein homolog [Contarinia nasturtii]